MTEPEPRPDQLPERDDVLEAAGARLRGRSRPVSAATIEAAVLRRRSRRLGVAAAASFAVAGLLAGALVAQSRTDADPTGSGGPSRPSTRPATAADDEATALLASLDAEPVDPTTVQLVSTVSTFPTCDALIGDLRRVGAEHVGSRGFGGFELGVHQGGAGARMSNYGAELAADGTGYYAAPVAPATGGDTLGTNVQVVGVDELDHVKAAGELIYDLDGRGNLRITRAGDLQVVATLDVTPEPADGPERQVGVQELLVHEGRVVVFGTEVEVSAAVSGDPSATRATTSYLTVAFVDASDPTDPTITDRVRIEGSLVSARLVDGEVRLVTTAHMADLGFVMPTTPASVPKALEQNRLSVATSSVADWIPDWDRADEAPEPLVPCERVHVPDTFAGVAMTSMVTFPATVGRFEPAGTSILAPGTTLYAGLDTVAVSSEVWVDPVDREHLDVDEWQTAIHRFAFTDGEAPGYEGSAIVDGSTVGQFAFGEIGDSLAVVTTEGTPWAQDPEVAVDLTVLASAGDGELAATAHLEDLADGAGAVSAVRFVPDRVLVSTGAFGRTVHVIDVTDPAGPRRAGSTGLPGDVGYFHPLGDGQALVVGSRVDHVGSGQSRTSRTWVQVHLLDVSDADAPQVQSSWERPWAADAVASDHHAFTYWPERQLAMWGVQDTRWQGGREPGPHHAVVLSTAGGVGEVAVPTASKPAEVAPPCPTVEVTDPDARQMVGPDGVVLRCEGADLGRVDWPRYRCTRVDDGLVARFAPGGEVDAAFFHCTPAPHPTVSRVLVVSGRPILLTDQTLEALDPESFQPTGLAYHPTEPSFPWFGY